MSSHSPINTDVVIVGAGIAGLWAACRLARRGESVVVLERGAIGEGQTIASQGIIHGGIKYALTGEASRASAAIARMPEVWAECVAGKGEIDLRGVRTLSTHQYLWTTPGVVSRIAGVGASKAIRTPVERVGVEERVGLLRDAPRGVMGVGGVDVYRVGEPVLDARSVVMRLAEVARGLGVVFVQWPGRGSASVPEFVAPEGRGEGARWGVRLGGKGDREAPMLWARAVVLAAGEGNETLARRAGVIREDEKIMQVRPLHMVMARKVPGELFGHCLGGTTTPRVTVTTFTIGHENGVEISGGSGVKKKEGVGGAGAEFGWYIGGEIAESGVGRSEEEQVAEAQREMGACLRWLDLSGCEYATLRINRAEGLTESGARPDEPVVRCLVREGTGGMGVVVGWPTKLAFAPEFATRVEGELEEAGVFAKRGNGGKMTGAEIGARLGAEGGGVVCSPPRGVEGLVTEPVWARRDVRWR